MKKNHLLFLLGLALTLTACDAPVEFPDDDTGVSVTTIKSSEGDTALTNSQTVIDPASLRDNTPVCLETSAPGLLVDGNAYASVDYSNTKEGYIIVDYFGSSPKVKLQITGPNGVTYTYDIQTGYAAFPLTSGAGDYEISVCENIEGTSYSLAFKTTINAPEVSTFGPYLYPNQYVYFDKNCKTVAKGAELASNCTNDLDVVTNVYNYITKHISYDYDKANTVKSGYISNVDEILDSGTGICLDYSAVMTSMLRSQSIPTRLEVGYVGKDMVYHAWISVYIEDIGWLNGIIQFDGKEWSLVDPTFGASTNERTLKEYIGDGTNYSTKYVY
ncbi:MAG: transglutaminase domain-containing protein [Lachnospiraceae bacterium]|nr:transglutaminase domain-containing protein [Lachnospiraceae bacterium]